MTRVQSHSANLQYLQELAKGAGDQSKIQGEETKRTGVYEIYVSNKKQKTSVFETRQKSLDKRHDKKLKNAEAFIRRALNNTVNSFPDHIQGDLTAALTSVMKGTFAQQTNVLRGKDFKELVDKATLEVTRAANKAFRDSGLDGFHDATVGWKVSDGGSGGVIFAKKLDNSEVVFKFDGAGNTKISQVAYQLLDGLKENVSDPLPFSFPKMAIVAPGDQDFRAIETKLNQTKLALENEAQKATSQTAADKANTKVAKITGRAAVGGNMSTGTGMIHNLKDAKQVCKFEMLDGAKPMNRISVDKKLGLIESEQFATQLGKSMVILQFLGLNDHLNIGESWQNSTNFSNLMVNDRNEIFVIDPKMMVENGNFGVSTKTLTAKLSGCIAAFGDISDPNKANKAVTDTVHNKYWRNAGDNSPFSNVLKMMLTKPDDSSTFFFQDFESINESAQQKGIDQNTLVRFSAALHKGALEGLQFLVENRAAIEGFTSKKNVPDFATDVTSVLQQLDTDLAKLNVDAIQDNLSQVMALHS